MGFSILRWLSNGLVFYLRWLGVPWIAGKLAKKCRRCGLEGGMVCGGMWFVVELFWREKFFLFC